MGMSTTNFGVFEIVFDRADHWEGGLPRGAWVAALLGVYLGVPVHKNVSTCHTRNHGMLQVHCGDIFFCFTHVTGEWEAFRGHVNHQFWSF